MEISGMIALEVPEDVLKERIRGRGKTSGRVDDQDEEKINTRIQVYLDETLPVADYYKNQGKLSNVDGVGEIDEIFNIINTCLRFYELMRQITKEITIIDRFPSNSSHIHRNRARNPARTYWESQTPYT